MARIIPVGFAEASVIYESTQGTGPFVTTFAVEVVNHPDVEPAQIANNIHTLWANNFKAVTSNAAIIDRVELAVGLPGGTSGSVVSSSSPVQGTFTGQMAPVTCAAILRKSTAYLGRSGRGRCYLPASVPSDQVSFGGQLTTSYRANLATKWQAFLAQMWTATEFEPIITYLLHNDPAQEPSVFTSGGVAEKVGYIRKRTY